MEINDETKWEEIHTKFKSLVKKYHPDKNQGNKKYEDKLKKITLAYSQLKNIRKKMSTERFIAKPDMKISVKQTFFGFDSEMQIDAFSKKNEYVPKIDPDYKFDKDTTLAILAGFLLTKGSHSRLSWNR